MWLIYCYETLMFIKFSSFDTKMWDWLRKNLNTKIKGYLLIYYYHIMNTVDF